MKHIYLFLFTFLLTATSLMAQVPQAMNYQAIARNASGNPYTNQSISLQLSVLDASASGTPQYVERQNITTNQFGLFTVAVGQGSVQSGTFSAINWGTNTKWLKVEMDPTGGTTFSTMGVSQLLSVPFALYAANGGGSSTVNVGAALTGNGTVGSPINLAQQGASNGQVLTWNGSAWTPAASTGADNWGTQLAITNTSLTGNGTSASPLGIAQQGATVGQVMTWSGSAWTPATSTGADNWGTQVTITDLTLTGNGTGVSPLGIAQQAATSGQVLGWNGTGWAPVTLSGSGPGDNWGSQVAAVNSTISGNGSPGSPLDIAQQGATSGQVLKWNGSTWAPAADIDNDAQTLTIAGTTLSISNGNSITLPSGGGTYTAGTGINVTGTVITNTGDTNPLDDITNTTTAGGDLSGTYPNPTVDGLQGNPVSALAPSNGQVLTWNGASWVPGTPASGGSYTAGTGISIVGNVISNTGSGATYTAGTGITIGGGNAINSTWTTSGTDIYNNNTGVVSVGTTVPFTNTLFNVNNTTAGGTNNTWGMVAANTTGGTSGFRVGMEGDGSISSSTTTGIGVLGFGNPFGMIGYGDGAGQDVLVNMFGTNEQVGVYGTQSATATGTVKWGVLGVSEDVVTGSTALRSIGVGGVGNSDVFGARAVGVYGTGSGTSNADLAVGVYGDTINQSTLPFYGSYAGYFNGDVDVVGFLTKGGGTFKIDHPQDPANKYLIHSFVESPDMMNIYNGNITTDASGDAIVQMPSYFEAENIDFRYQLTVMGQFAQAIVMEEISHNQFKIKTDKPNVKVSWMVTGVRNDKYAQAHRVVPEVNKKGKEIGKYLYPSVYGLSSRQGISATLMNRGNAAQGHPLANQKLNLKPASVKHKK